MRRRKLSKRYLLIVTVLAPLAGSLGCTSGEQASVTPVSGKVLLDGEPLKFGTVTFQPSRGQPARGEIQADGEFTLSTYREADGAAVGRHKVKITSYTSQDPTQKEGSGGSQEALGESLIPERYTRLDTSGLEVAVLAGGNKPFEFALESEPAEPEDMDDGEDGVDQLDEVGAPQHDNTQPPT